MDQLKSTLLLIEDDADDVYFFRRALQLSGQPFVCHHLSNGYAAMDFLQSAARTLTLPRVVVLDLKLPILNGFEVLEWLQKQLYAEQVSVMVLSGSEHQEDRARAMELGAEAYFVKPISVEELLQALENLEPIHVLAPSVPGGEKP